MIKRNELDKVLKTSRRFTGGDNSILDVLNSFKITVSSKFFKVEATNAEFASVQWISILDTGVTGELLVPAAKLTDTIGAFLAEDVTFNIVDNKINLSSGKQKVKIIGNSDVMDFPVIPDFPVTFFTVDTKEFSEKLNSVLFCGALDSSNPILRCVSMKYMDGSLKMATSDGYRAAMNELFISSGIDPQLKAAVSIKFLKEVLSLAKGTETIDVAFDGSRIYVRTSNAMFQSVLTNQKIIDPSKGFEQALDFEFDFIGEEADKAAKLAEVFALDSNKPRFVKVEAIEGAITLSAAGEDGEAKVEFPVDFNGEFGGKHGVDIGYFREICKAFDVMTCSLTADSTSKFIFKSAKDPSWKALISSMNV